MPPYYRLITALLPPYYRLITASLPPAHAKKHRNPSKKAALSGTALSGVASHGIKNQYTAL
ncbi:hypothetical protein [Ostreibacterium oceani]|uniref:Uncharacterized protein n=1 Tax=Ostreibacterium oceani TaxID=2654998 RepID=A0A6N7F1Q9_9GAMM|nr:hypothetical protein [Ostreibacterium oceani]MPV85796.1 hypothetical protein [Ostreibacterium oceani]